MFLVGGKGEFVRFFKDEKYHLVHLSISRIVCKKKLLLSFHCDKIGLISDKGRSAFSASSFVRNS